MDNNFFTAMVTACGTLCGVFITKWFDGHARAREIVARKEAVDATLVSEATKTLIEGLLNSLRQVQSDVAQLREELAQCEAKHNVAEEQLTELRMQIRVLQASAPTLTLGVATGCNVAVSAVAPQLEAAEAK